MDNTLLYLGVGWGTVSGLVGLSQLFISSHGHHHHLKTTLQHASAGLAVFSAVILLIAYLKRK